MRRQPDVQQKDPSHHDLAHWQMQSLEHWAALEVRARFRQWATERVSVSVGAFRRYSWRRPGSSEFVARRDRVILI
jgi:hypothetical protein